jgi:hypothetical protein
MFVFVPGYFRSYIDLLRYDLAVGSNLGIPVPWPWRLPADFGPLLGVTFLFEGCFYLAMPIFFLAVCVRLFRSDRLSVLRQPLFLAAIAVTLPYAHYAFSRADYVHLAHAVPPLILGVLALAGSIGTIAWLPHLTALVLFMGTIPATAIHTAFIREALSASGSHVPMPILGQTMYLPRRTASVLNIADILANKLARKDESIVFLPHWPGLYPAMGRLSPLWQTYFIRPASPAEEAQVIASLERRRVQWVLLQDERLDNRDDLRFCNTNPRTFRYFRANFESLAVPGLPRDTVILRRKELLPDASPQR